MRIADVLRGKGGAVVTIKPDATVAELLAGLAEHNIGAMVVAGPDGVDGIVSERDVVRQLHSHGASVLSRRTPGLPTPTPTAAAALAVSRPRRPGARRTPRRSATSRY